MPFIFKWFSRKIPAAVPYTVQAKRDVVYVSVPWLDSKPDLRFALSPCQALAFADLLSSAAVDALRMDGSSIVYRSVASLEQ